MSSEQNVKPYHKIHATISKKLYKAMKIRGIIFLEFDEFVEKALWRALDEWDSQHPRK